MRSRDAQCNRLFCVLRGVDPIVQLGYHAITNIFVVNQIIRYNEVFATTNIFFGTVTLRCSGVPLYLITKIKGHKYNRCTRSRDAHSPVWSCSFVVDSTADYNGKRTDAKQSYLAAGIPVHIYLFRRVQLTAEGII